jgi:hypothetical protein
VIYIASLKIIGKDAMRKPRCNVDMFDSVSICCCVGSVPHTWLNVAYLYDCSVESPLHSVAVAVPMRKILVGLAALSFVERRWNSRHFLCFEVHLVTHVRKVFVLY